jgi:UDP-N-acetylmuramate: L-alanyl-gamma-D-glutamyl-meso-diaminopimelate ligase
MKIHFISIGGSVMHQLAIALKRKGYQITGSDDEIFEPARSNLKAEGILPESIGWKPEKLQADLEAVILGMHARADNPELIRAKELNLPIYSFPEYIYKESQNKTRVVVGGSHGKTTTTAMIMHVLKDADRSFDYLVGARLAGFSQSVNITDAPVIVCEGDEYPASAIERRPKFHFLFPHIAVLTGIAWDHINIFPTFDNYLEQFRIFIQKIHPGGHLIYNETDPVLAELVETTKRQDVFYHPYSIPEHKVENGVTSIVLEGEQAQLKVFGNHNLLNLCAAWEVCKQLNVPTSIFLQSIAAFTGAANRLQPLKQTKDVSIFRDFAHAPSKVKATIDAVKEQFPDRKLIAVLELHTYSSLNKEFLKEYNGVMKKADEAAVFFSRHALEIKKLPALEPEWISEGFGSSDLTVINEKNELERWLSDRDFRSSVLLLMSSGNYEGMDLEKLSGQVIAHQN